MTSKSSKLLPYLTVLIVATSLAIEGFYGVEIDLETALPFLIAIGLGGAGLKAVERASQARKALTPEIESLIKSEITKLKG